MHEKEHVSSSIGATEVAVEVTGGGGVFGLGVEVTGGGGVFGLGVEVGAGVGVEVFVGAGFGLGVEVGAVVGVEVFVGAGFGLGVEVCVEGVGAWVKGGDDSTVSEPHALATRHAKVAVAVAVAANRVA